MKEGEMSRDERERRGDVRKGLRCWVSSSFHCLFFPLTLKKILVHEGMGDKEEERGDTRGGRREIG